MLSGLGTKAWSAIAASVVMVSAVIAGVAVANDDGFDPVHAPQWQPGYTFSYDVTGSMEASVDGAEDYLGDMPSDVSGAFDPIQVKKEVLNTADYTSDHGEPLYVSAANFPLGNIQSGQVVSDLGQGSTFIMAERQSDLAPLAVVWTGSGLDVAVDNPLTYLNFPLTEGKKWTQEEELPIPLGIDELAGITRVHIVGEVGGMETVDLGGDLGETEAVRVDFAYRPVGLESILKDIAAKLEDAGMDIDRFNIQLGLHEIVYYSPEYEAIVQQQYLLSMLFDVAISGEAFGQSFDEQIYAEFSGTIQALLSGSNRAVTEQLSPDEINAKLGNVDLINDARGLGASKVSVPYSILLEPSAQSINVARGESLGFGVRVAGQMPEDHRLEYIVRHLDGAELARGAANSGFSFTPDVPGVYGVTVRSLDADDKVVTTSTTRYVEGDFDATVSAACYIGVTGTDCEPYRFQVAPYADSAVFEVRRYSGTPPLGQEVRVTGPDGWASGYERIELDDHQLRNMGYGTWDISYNTNLGLLNEADYTISVDYKAPRSGGLVLHERSSSGEDGASGGDGQAPGGVFGMLGRLVQTADGGLASLEQGQVQIDFSQLI